MKRGDLVSVVLPGDYGKPRPALIVQSDGFGHLDSTTVLPLTSEIIEAAEDEVRIEISPTAENGLRKQSHIMIDKIGTLRRSKVGPVMGRVSNAHLAAVDRALATFLGFA